MPRPTRRPAARPQRRKLVWTRSYVGSSAVPAAGTEIRDDLLSAVSVPPGCTVMRVRGRMVWTPSVYTTAQAIRVGLKVDSSQQVITDEGPVTSFDDDWFMLEPFIYEPRATGTGDVTDLQWQTANLTRDIDVKAMRRLAELQDTIWLYAESQSGGAASELSYDLSLLLALP